MTYFESGSITFEAALRDLAGGSDRARAQAATALGDVVEPSERPVAVKALVTALDDRRPEIRAAASLSLGELGGERAVENLVLVLDDGIPHVRQSAAIALGRSGSESAFEPLRGALTEGPPDLRFQAATSLVEIDAERALEPLLSRLGAEEDPQVVGAIALALGAIGDPSAIEPLAARLEDADRASRFDVAYGLARLGDRRAAPVLQSGLEDRAHAWDAIEGLELSGDPAAAEPLAALFDKRRLPREIRLRAAAASLALDPDGPTASRAREELESGLRAFRLPHRALAVELLGRVGDRWALEPLRALRGRRGGRALIKEIDECLARLEGAERDGRGREESRA